MINYLINNQVLNKNCKMDNKILNKNKFVFKILKANNLLMNTMMSLIKKKIMKFQIQMK